MPRRKPRSPAEEKAIKRYYATHPKKLTDVKPPRNSGAVSVKESVLGAGAGVPVSHRDKFPKRFPFWARLKIGKNRTTLVIDEAPVLDKKKHEIVDGFVHREAIHSDEPRSDYEQIVPNPDRTDKRPMYLKRPKKHPQYLLKPHNRDLVMPEDLRERYEKNNKDK